MYQKWKRRTKKKPFNHTDISVGRYVAPPHNFGGCWQTEAFFNSTSRVKALFGGNRSGKTHTNVARQLYKIRDNPGIITWAAIGTADMIGQTLWPKYKELSDRSEIKTIAWANKAKGIPSVVTWFNDAVTWFKTFQQGRETFQAAAVDDILLSEEPPQDIYKECLARVIDRHGQVCLDMTPLKGLTWPYHEIDQDNVFNLRESWRISLFDNPFIPQADKDEIVSLYGKDEVKRRIEGLFEMVQGAVFKEWQPKLSVLEDFPKIPASWRRVAGIDLGYVHPFVCVWMAVSPDGEFFIYDEYYQAGEVMEYHSAQIQQHEQDSLESFLCDHLSFSGIESRVCDHERQNRAELEFHGVWTEPANKDVELSVQFLNRLMKPRANGKPSLFVAPWCEHVIQEFSTCHWKEIRTGAEQKEVIAKIDDDTVDAVRYAAMYFFEDEGGHYGFES
jgi:phage terminase large subunit-like protein